MDSIDAIGSFVWIESDGNIFDLVEANDKGEEDDSSECASDCQRYFFVSGHNVLQTTIMFIDSVSFFVFCFYGRIIARFETKEKYF